MGDFNANPKLVKNSEGTQYVDLNKGAYTWRKEMVTKEGENIVQESSPDWGIISPHSP